MVKTKTWSVDDKYLPVHYNLRSNLVDYMRKKQIQRGKWNLYQNDIKNIIDPLLEGQHGLKQHIWQTLKK